MSTEGFRATRVWWMPGENETGRHPGGGRAHYTHKSDDVLRLQSYLQGHIGEHLRKNDVARAFGVSDNTLIGWLTHLTHMDTRVSEDPDTGQIYYRTDADVSTDIQGSWDPNMPV